MLKFNIVAPTAGDKRLAGGKDLLNPQRSDPWNGRSFREPTLPFVQQFFIQAEKAGFDSILLGTGDSLLIDPLVSASALISCTERIRFLMAIRPGVSSPALFARQLAAVDYYSRGRAMVNIVTGGSPADLAADGDFLDHAARYRRTREFLHVLRRFFREESFDHKGDYYVLKDAQLALKAYGRLQPEIYLGGQSQAAMEVAAELADVYLMYAETCEEDVERLGKIRELAVGYGRGIDAGITFVVVLGETEEDAWRNASALLPTGQETAAVKEAYVATGESQGLKRLHRLMEGAKEINYVIGPNRWAGLTQVATGSSVALVGTPDQVADRIVEYASLGFTDVLFRGFPLLESVEALGRDVLPRVRAKLTHSLQDQDKTKEAIQ